jgi:outer membrane protein assembly factor BamE (lipoprotein component of BamABCDE complex)
MKLLISRCTAILLCVLAFTACQPGKRFTKANVDEVQTGMAKKQVESILGLPTTTEAQDLGGSKMTTYIYNQGSDVVRIVFRDDKMQSKESTLTE